MTKKQKKMLIRILITAVMLIALKFIPITLDADGMAAVAGAIAPDAASLDIEFTEGTLEIVLNGDSLTSITFSCGGTLRLLLTDTNVSFRAVINPASRETAIPQQVLSALQ